MRQCVHRPCNTQQCQLNSCSTQSLLPAMVSPLHRVTRVFMHYERRHSWGHSGDFQGQRALLPHEEEWGAFLSLQPWVGWWPGRTFTVRARATSVHVRQGCSSAWSNWNSLEWTSRTQHSTKCGHLSFSCSSIKRSQWSSQGDSEDERRLCMWDACPAHSNLMILELHQLKDICQQPEDSSVSSCF